jgi:hypothetical protein
VEARPITERQQAALRTTGFDQPALAAFDQFTRSQDPPRPRSFFDRFIAIAILSRFAGALLDWLHFQPTQIVTRFVASVVVVWVLFQTIDRGYRAIASWRSTHWGLGGRLAVGGRDPFFVVTEQKVLYFKAKRWPLRSMDFAIAANAKAPVPIDATGRDPKVWIGDRPVTINDPNGDNLAWLRTWNVCALTGTAVETAATVNPLAPFQG